MKKIDLRAQYKSLYRLPSRQAVVVEVPPLKFLTAHGEGDPNTAPAYKEAVTALFTLAYTVKFLVKRSDLAVDYGVMPLEGLWWADIEPIHVSDKKSWKWTAMILQPDFVDSSIVEEARSQAIKKKRLPTLTKVELATLHEGRSAQLMHSGPYSAETPSIEALHQFIEEQGGRPRGKHHEIYLNDPSRTAPEKLKTVLRQPFA